MVYNQNLIWLAVKVKRSLKEQTLERVLSIKVTATVAEIRKGIMTLLKYALDRSNGGGRRVKGD